MCITASLTFDFKLCSWRRLFSCELDLTHVFRRDRPEQQHIGSTWNKKSSTLLNCWEYKGDWLQLDSGVVPSCLILMFSPALSLVLPLYHWQSTSSWDTSQTNAALSFSITSTSSSFLTILIFLAAKRKQWLKKETFPQSWHCHCKTDCVVAHSHREPRAWQRCCHRQCGTCMCLHPPGCIG